MHLHVKVRECRTRAHLDALLTSYPSQTRWAMFPSAADFPLVLLGVSVESRSYRDPVGVINFLPKRAWSEAAMYAADLGWELPGAMFEQPDLSGLVT